MISKDNSDAISEISIGGSTFQYYILEGDKTAINTKYIRRDNDGNWYYGNNRIAKFGFADNSLLGEIETVTLPNGSKVVAMVRGNVAVQVDKVKKFMRGHSPDLSSTEKNEFDRLSKNEKTLSKAELALLNKLKDLKDNFDRSIAMKNDLEAVGLFDTDEANNLIFNALLDAGDIAKKDGERIRIVAVGSNGDVGLESVWAIYQDGTRYPKYMKTVWTKGTPRRGRGE